MTLFDMISPDRIFLGVRVGDKAQLLREVARRAAPHVPADAEAIYAALDARERLGSTGVGRGVALPHARLAGISMMFTLFFRLARPIAFEAIDGRPVDIVVLLLVPLDSTSHVAALAAIARTLRVETTMQKIRAAETAIALHDTFHPPLA